MKYTSTQNQIYGAIKTLSKIATKNTTLPILKTIKLEIINNVLILNATNLDVGAVITLPVKDSVDGKCAVDASIFLSYLSLIPVKSKIEIENTEGHLVIRSEKGVAKITTVDVSDFPEIPQSISGGANKIKIKASHFIEGIKSVVFSCAVSAMRPELASVYIYPKENTLTFVATDTFRLAEKTIKTGSIDLEPMLIPAKVAQEIVKLFADEGGDIELLVEEGQITLEIDSLRVVARTIAGNFPDYQQIIPKDTLTEVTILKDELQGALRAATIFSDKFNQITIKVDVESKKMIFDAKNSTAGENSFDINGSIKGESVALNFNYNYFSEVLSVLSSDSIYFVFNGPGKAVVIKEKGGNDFLYLVMPMSKNV